MRRTNETWIEHLGGSGPNQEAALSDLRSLLLERLRRSFSDRQAVDEAFIEDVVQEALMKALQSLERFEGRSQFTTWVTSIAVRGAFTQLRRHHWKDVSLDQILANPEGLPGDAADDSPSPARSAQQNALLERMYGFIDTDLTKKQGDALCAELSGMPLEEIGRRIGSNRNAVYKLTHDARKRLRRSFDAAGITVEDVWAAFEGR